MINRPMLLSVVMFVIAPLGIATWILATYTVGESLNPVTPGAPGFAVALLAVMAAAYVFLLTAPLEGANARFGITLVICGTSCVLVALALQFFLASLAAENSHRVAEIMANNLKRGEQFNVNLNANLPKSVTAIAYLALFAGIWLAAMGIRYGAGRAQPEEASRFSLTSSEPPRVEEGIRHVSG